MRGLAGLALLATLAACRAAAADLRSNAQAWAETDVLATLAPDWRVTFLAVARTGADLPNPTLWGGGAILDHAVGPWTLSAGDLEVAARSPVSGATLDVNVPLAAVSYGWRWGGFMLSDRNRFEDLVGVPGDPWRYRNRIAVEHPLRVLAPFSTVFASEEAFFDFATGRWSRSRAQLGVGLTAARHVEARVYYLRQDEADSRPRAINGLGLTLALALN